MHRERVGEVRCSSGAERSGADSTMASVHSLLGPPQLACTMCSSCIYAACAAPAPPTQRTHMHGGATDARQTTCLHHVLQLHCELPVALGDYLGGQKAKSGGRHTVRAGCAGREA